MNTSIDNFKKLYDSINVKQELVLENFLLSGVRGKIKLKKEYRRYSFHFTFELFGEHIFQAENSSIPDLVDRIKKTFKNTTFIQGRGFVSNKVLEQEQMARNSINKLIDIEQETCYVCFNKNRDGFVIGDCFHYICHDCFKKCIKKNDYNYEFICGICRNKIIKRINEKKHYIYDEVSDTSSTESDQEDIDESDDFIIDGEDSS
jgi:hypothetical protein